MTRKIAVEEIFTPQGTLGNVSKKPNLDFLMNIFNIPRIYSVSGFGSWNVGQHTVATAFLALYWSSFNKYPQDLRDRLVTLALIHDAHEAVTGDILPYFKTADVRLAIQSIQDDILKSFSIVQDNTLRKELKLIDMISFLYEIAQSTPTGIGSSKKSLIQKMHARQKTKIMEFSKKQKIDVKKVELFLKTMKL